MRGFCILTKLTAPCVNCDKKGCGSYHDKCPEYQQFKKANNDQIIEKHRRINDLQLYVDSIRDGQKRMRRSRRK